MTTSLETEALVILAEEAAEVQKAVAKILRFGFDSKYPSDGFSNKEKLISEIGDFRAAVYLTEEWCDINTADVIEAEAKKLRDYAHGRYLRNYKNIPDWFKHV